MRKGIIILWASILLITGCVPATPSAVVVETQTPARTPTLTRTPKPTKTPFPTKTPTVTPIPPTLSLTPSPTSTPQAPLVEHEWSPETILIMLRDNLGDGGIDLGDLGSPPFVLYADGSLYIRHATEISTDEWQVRVLVKKLSSKEICQHLNTLDQIGYIDYDPSDYTYINSDRPFVIGASETFITANAWKSKSSKYYGLSTALEEYNLKDYYGQKGYPVIAPALRNTYYFLNNYPVDGFEIYKPDRLAVWLFPYTNAHSEYLPTPEKWELNQLSLSELFERAKPLQNFDYESFVILTGSEAKSMYAYFGEEDSRRDFEVENADGSKTYYAVGVRPLLPYEMPGEYYMSEFPNLPKPDFKLHCYPSDGTLPIPTTSYP